MRCEFVDSETLRAVGYSTQRRELRLIFETGDIYAYFEVSPEEHAEFMAAPSKGAYLNHAFNPRAHRYILVRPGPRPKRGLNRCKD